MSFLFTGDFCGSKSLTQTNKHYFCGPAKASGTSKGQQGTKPWGTPHLGSEVSELPFPILYQVNEKVVLNASLSGSWLCTAAVQQVKSQLWLLCWAQHSGNRELCLQTAPRLTGKPLAGRYSFLKAGTDCWITQRFLFCLLCSSLGVLGICDAQLERHMKG